MSNNFDQKVDIFSKNVQLLASKGDKMKEALKAARKACNLTQDEASKILGVPRSTYCHYEQGVTSPSPEMIKKIAETFHVSTDFLLGHHIDYLFDKSILSKEQIEVIDEIIKLTPKETLQVSAFIKGLKSN